MKRVLTIILFHICTFLISQDAITIINRADEMFKNPSIYSESSMTITQNGKEKPVQSMTGYSMEIGGKYHSLSVYNSPARMKGTAYLMIEDDLWVRFSSTGRVRKLSSSAKKNSAGGSDFSYADMGDGNKGIADKYSVKLLGREEIGEIGCYKIELLPKKGEDAPYERLITYISVDKFHYIKMEYYEGGANIKNMFLKDYRAVGLTFYPFFIEMVSSTKDSVTVIESHLVEFDSKRVQRRLFTQAYLESIR